MRGPALSRDHLIAASLAGAVVVVVGYASGIGLRPGSAAPATPPVVADGGQQGTPAAEDPIPAGEPPADVPVSALPAVPVAGAPAALPPDVMPSLPGGVGVEPAPVTETPVPPETPVPEPPPPGTDLPACQPGVAQQVLDTVGGLPLLGSVTTGLGVTGPDGLGATVLGYCRTADGAVQQAMVPAPVATGR